MDETKFHLELNLQKISMVSIATKLWDTEEIKKQIKTCYFIKKNLYKNAQDDCWSSIAENVLHYLNATKLPSCFLDELTETIRLIGQKIFNWIFYVTGTLKLDYIFCEKIYWTSYGIDEAKIFNCYWRELMSSNDFRTDQDSYKRSTAFSLACMYRCETFINDHVNEMTEELVNFYPLTSLTTDEIYNIMTLYICSHLGESFDDNVSRPLNMFKLCVKAGFSKAAKFYWTKLNEIDKNSNLYCFVLELCYFEDDDREIFIQEKYCELLYFLISQLGEEEIRSIFEVDGDKVIQTFLSIWPYQGLVLNFLDYDWDLEIHRLMQLFRLILEWKVELRKSKCNLLDELYFQILKLIWDKFSEEEKDIFVCRYTKRQLLINLVLSSDFRTLNLILKDAVINDGIACRGKVLHVCTFLLEKENFSAVDEFVEKVFSSNPELVKDPLKRDFSKIATCLVKQNKLDTANQFLNWLSDSDEEKSRLKSEIDASLVCFKLTGGSLYGFKLADNFLKWRLETEGDVRNFKEGMKTYSFITTMDEEYIRIKSGDLSHLKIGDNVSWQWTDDFGEANSEGFTFIHFADVGHSTLPVIFVTDRRLRVLHLHINGRKSSTVKFIGTKPGDFVLNRILKIWNFSYNEESVLVEASNAFIKFYYETDEEVMNFKNITLKSLLRFDSENLVKFLFNHFMLQIDALDAFLNFCLKSPSETNEIKVKIRDELEKLLGSYTISWGNEIFTDFCIKLYCHIAGEDKWASLIRKFPNSPDKATLPK